MGKNRGLDAATFGFYPGQTLLFGAEDGIRTRDPHLGKKKVAEPVHRVLSSPLACRRVHPVSTQSTGFAPGVERSTTSGILDEHPSVEDR